MQLRRIIAREIEEDYKYFKQANTIRIIQDKAAITMGDSQYQPFSCKMKCVLSKLRWAEGHNYEAF